MSWELSGESKELCRVSEARSIHFKGFVQFVSPCLKEKRLSLKVKMAFIKHLTPTRPIKILPFFPFT